MPTGRRSETGCRALNDGASRMGPSCRLAVAEHVGCDAVLPGSTLPRPRKSAECPKHDAGALRDLPDTSMPILSFVCIHYYVKNFHSIAISPPWRLRILLRRQRNVVFRDGGRVIEPNAMLYRIAPCQCSQNRSERAASFSFWS